MNNGRGWFAAGAVSGLIAVAAGAFGSHGLRDRLDPGLLATFEIGVRYQMYHSLALLATAWASERLGGRWPGIAGSLFVAGTVVFSGSLYLLALTGQRWLGAITPIGGAALLAGWALLAVAAARHR